MGGNFSLGWLAPKEDLGPWGSPGQGDDLREPVSLVLTEGVFKRWQQVHQERVGRPSAESMLKPRGNVEETGTNSTGEVEVYENNPATGADRGIMEGYQGGEEHAVISASAEYVEKGEGRPKLATVDEKKTISSSGAGGDGDTSDETTPMSTPLTNFAYQHQDNFRNQFRHIEVEHVHVSKMDQNAGRVAELEFNHESSDVNPAVGAALQGEANGFIDFGKETYLLPDNANATNLLLDMPSFDTSIPPFISEFETDLPNNLRLNVLANMAKASFSKMPEVASTFTQSDDDLDMINAERNLEKCRKVEEFWSKKLDSEISKVATKLESDMDAFLQRAERVKKLIPPPQKIHDCAKHIHNISHCYTKNAAESFKCQDVIKEFSKCVGQSEWPGMAKLQN